MIICKYLAFEFLFWMSTKKLTNSVKFWFFSLFCQTKRTGSPCWARFENSRRKSASRYSGCWFHWTWRIPYAAKNEWYCRGYSWEWCWIFRWNLQFFSHIKCDAIWILISFLHTDHIRPICLPIEKSLRSRKFVGDTPFVAGWGDTEETGSPAQALMQLQVPVVDNTVCRKKAFQAGAKYADYQIKNHVICADAFEGRRFWSGDSGSPLMLPVYQNESHSNPFPFYQIGLVSYSYEFEDVVVPDVFTRVTYFVDWIAEQIEKKWINRRRYQFFCWPLDKLQ